LVHDECCLPSRHFIDSTFRALAVHCVPPLISHVPMVSVPRADDDRLGGIDFRR
jgi:hypothetical protein